MTGPTLAVEGVAKTFGAVRAVDDVARVVHGEAAVGVTVVGDAEVGAVFNDGLREVVEVGGAHPVVDVDAVGVGADQRHPGAGIREHLRRHAGRGTVRAVENEVDAVEAVRQRPKEVHDVTVFRVGETTDASHIAAGGRQLVEVEVGLDAILDLVGELGAAEGEELDAVVGCGVVRRGDHDAEVGVDVRDEERCRGGGDHARVEHVDAGAREPGGHGRGEELTGDAGVAGDDGHGPPSLGATLCGAAALGQDCGARLGEAQGQASREITVGQAPDTVRTE